MTVSKEKQGNALTVTIAGILDAKTTPMLSEALEGELEDITELYFDMKNLEYTSSIGLRVLLSAYQTIDDKDGRMVLRHVNNELKELFDDTGFTNFLEFED